LVEMMMIADQREALRRSPCHDKVYESRSDLSPSRRPVRQDIIF
jgi:hypothetical protein